MSKAVETQKAIRGGEFLIRETLASEIFIPEEFNEEQKMIRQQCKDFLDKEVFNLWKTFLFLLPSLGAQAIQ